MKFETILSKRQIASLFYILLGIILIYLGKTSSNAGSVLRILGALFIGINFISLVEESVKRYKIIYPFKTNKYDSKAEEEIANYFTRKNIIFHHHHGISVPKTFCGFNIPLINIDLEPDFFLPEFNVFVEYWGLIENPEYKKSQYDFKMKLYQENDIDVISLYPKNLKNLDWDFTMKLLELIKIREGNNRKWR